MGHHPEADRFGDHVIDAASVLHRLGQRERARQARSLERRNHWADRELYGVYHLVQLVEDNRTDRQLSGKLSVDVGQRTRLDLARLARVGIEIGGVAPALDRHRKKVARLDQVGQPRLEVVDREAEVVAEVARGGDAQGP